MHGHPFQSIALFGPSRVLAENAVGGRAPARFGFPACRGRVERFILAAGTKVDGLPPADGTEVDTPPHLSAAVTAGARFGATPGGPTVREGRIRLSRHGMRGDVDGLLPTDGATVRIAPSGASALPDAFRPGSIVVAGGEVRASARGTAILPAPVLSPAFDGPPHPFP